MYILIEWSQIEFSFSCAMAENAEIEIYTWKTQNCCWHPSCFSNHFSLSYLIITYIFFPSWILSCVFDDAVKKLSDIDSKASRYAYTLYYTYIVIFFSSCNQARFPCIFCCCCFFIGAPPYIFNIPTALTSSSSIFQLGMDWITQNARGIIIQIIIKDPAYWIWCNFFVRSSHSWIRDCHIKMKLHFEMNLWGISFCSGFQMVVCCQCI